MISLRPHRQFDFVRLWKPGFILSGCLIALAIVGFVASFVTTGSPLTLGTEFSGGTSIQLYETGDITEKEITQAFNDAADDLDLESTVSSVQTATDSDGNPGFIVKTTDTDSTNSNKIVQEVEETLEIDSSNAQVETIGASWGASVIRSAVIAFLLSCVAILIVIAIRYGEPRMGVSALIKLLHDIVIMLGVYAWMGMFVHMEITSDVIAALLAIIGYSLYDTVVVFHRIHTNASPQMKCCMKTCANRSVNQIIVRSLNTSITSILPVLMMVILGSDTLFDFAFAMLCGMIIGVYSTLAISTPIFTLWMSRKPEYARLEKKYPYEVVQSTFTTEMMRQARKDAKAQKKLASKQAKEEKAQAKKDAAKEKQEAQVKKAAQSSEKRQEAEAEKAVEKASSAPAAEEAAGEEAPEEEAPEEGASGQETEVELTFEDDGYGEPLSEYGSEDDEDEEPARNEDGKAASR